jgi:hypothetical protein
VTIVTNGQSKVDFTDARVIIDDKLATCIDFNKDGRSAILFDRVGAHVGSDVFSPFLRHARTWDDVITIMEAYRA